MERKQTSMLTKARVVCGITQAQMAERLDVDVGTICRWEQHPERLPLEKVKSYYDAIPELNDEDVVNFFKQPLIIQ